MQQQGCGDCTTPNSKNINQYKIVLEGEYAPIYGGDKVYTTRGSRLFFI